MKKFTTILALIFLIDAAFAGPVHASKRSNRPWMSGQSRSALSTPKVRKSRTVSARSERRVSRSSDTGEQIADQAHRYRGTRYRFGGDSKYKGFDCSGLIRRVYNDLNIKKLPHTSGGMYQMGAPIRLTELRPGDLVFFKNTYKRGISHVGVYTGDNRFIHAQNRRRGVTLTSLSDPYYQLHYAGARRLY